MTQPEREDSTHILSRVARGDETASGELFTLVYDQLKRIAANYLRRERAEHTWQATDLAHEAYIKMINRERAAPGDRAHFFAIAATAIRRILVDHARHRKRQKRGGGVDPVTLRDDAVASSNDDLDLVALDEALLRLRRRSERLCQVVELRFFGGLTEVEVANVLRVSRNSVGNDWKFARALLRRELS